MRLKKIIALIGLCIALHTEIQCATFLSIPAFNLASGNDSLIKETWARFSKAIIKKDLKMFKAMSTDCINCTWCVTNTVEEDTVFKVYRIANGKTWRDKLYSEFSFISIDKFIYEDYDVIFTKKTRTRMRNKFNFVFSDITDYPGLYSKPCIIDRPDESKLDPKEVLLVDVDAAPKHEGPRMAFAFIKINGQYKFCGFSCIP